MPQKLDPEALDHQSIKSYKLSKYNHFIDYAEKIFLIYNASSSAIIETNKKYYLMLKDGANLDALPIDMQTILVENNILVPKEVDELSQIAILDKAKRFANNSLSLTIAPTLDCNFSCKYCYEKHKPIYMDQQTQKNILDFIEFYLGDIIYLDVVWYGGEPLSAKNTVFELTENINKLCNKYQVKKNFSIITNGYLMDYTVIQQMHALGIDGVQVTLDGPPEIHNARRPLSNGGRTFETIINNLKACEGKIKNLTIRVNIDKDNINGLLELKDILHKEGILRFAKLAISHVDAYSESNKIYEPNCLNMFQFSDFYVEHFVDEIKRGIYNIPRPPNGCGCGAIALNSWVIAPDGYLYKCWCEIGYENKKVGHITTPNKLNHNYYEWLSFNILDFDICNECNVLPLCMGACPDKIKNIGPGIFCTRWKFCLTEMLILYALTKKVETPLKAKEISMNTKVQEAIKTLLDHAGIPEVAEVEDIKVISAGKKEGSGNNPCSHEGQADCQPRCIQDDIGLNHAYHCHVNNCGGPRCNTVIDVGC